MPAAPAPLHLGQLPAAQTVLSGHFDADRQLDVARLTQTGIWQVGLSQGPAFSMNPWGTWSARSLWRSFVVGDFNGDKLDDVAGFKNGAWTVGLSDGARFNDQYWGYWGSASRWSRFLSGDFDGDGQQDMAGFTRQGTWVVGLSTGSRFDTATWARWGNGWVGVWSGDFNGDGKTDVAGLGADGTFRVGISLGNTFSNNDWGQFASGHFAVDVEVGDFNGDHKDDLATLSASGIWTVGLSAESRFVPHLWGRWRGVTSLRDIGVADVDGDRQDDLLALASSGRWLAGISQKDSFTTLAWARSGHRIPSGAHLQIGDLDGNRLTDAAVFLPDGLWLGAFSGGAAAQVADMGQWPLGLDAFPYRGDIIPYAGGAPWLASNSRVYVDNTAPVTLSDMYFNSPRTYRLYVENFYGVVHSWVHEADRLHLRKDDGLRQLLSRHLEAYYEQTRRLLTSQYPGHQEQTYRLLLALNLAHGYYIYATTYGRGRSLYRTLHLRTGDCSEIADLLVNLVRAGGVRARELAQIYNYPSALGPFQATHVVVYAGGLWLDAEINTALAVDLNAIARVPPGNRLQHLLNHRRAFGFYDWYLEPRVRADQLARGLDGGIIAFYYQHYLAGIGQGNTLLYFIRGK